MYRRALFLILGFVMACNGASRDAMRNEQGGALDRDLQPPARTPDVIFVPTKMQVVEQMLALARVGPNDTVYDLGSGDGRIVITAASRHGARGVGIDIDPQRIRESLANADSAKVTGKVQFRQADLFHTDLRPATIVTLYLLPSLNRKLQPKLFNELRPGTPVVSNSFDMGEWEPDSSVIIDNRHVYLWHIPANASGTWHLAWGDTSASPRAELQLTQRFQKLFGTVRIGNRTDSVSNGRLAGDTIRFTITADGRPTEFIGRVAGARMTGSTQGGMSNVAWKASRRGNAGSPLPMR